jgi:hypothetical protein
MARVTSLNIDTWDGRFIVSAEFPTFTEIPRTPFEKYQDALNELIKIAKREAMRYELGNGDRFTR